jgi:hypothetical protein
VLLAHCKKGDATLRSVVVQLALRMLMAAALWSLPALRAAAHPAHGHDRPAISALMALEKPVEQVALHHPCQEETAVTTSIEVAAFGACCGQDQSWIGCSPGTTCGCAVCGPCGALAASDGGRLRVCAKGMVAVLWQQAPTGLGSTPADRPPRC